MHSVSVEHAPRESMHAQACTSACALSLVSALCTLNKLWRNAKLSREGFRYTLSLALSVQPLAVELRGDGGRTARGESAALLTKAARRPLDPDAVAGAVGELGGSTLALRRLDLSALDLGAGAGCSLDSIPRVHWL